MQTVDNPDDMVNVEDQTGTVYLYLNGNLVAYNQDGTRKWSVKLDESPLSIVNRGNHIFVHTEKDPSSSSLEVLNEDGTYNTKISNNARLCTFNDSDNTYIESIDGLFEIPAPFVDIKGHWAESVIRRLINTNIINGFKDGTFRPNANITRDQFVTLLVKIEGLKPVSGQTTFSDESMNYWSTPYIEAAVNAGIIQKSDYQSYFHPNQSLTRQEAAIMAARALHLTNDESSLKFQDNYKIQNNRGLVGASVKAGIFLGNPDNTFRPDKAMTRAEACVILERIFDYKG